MPKTVSKDSRRPSYHGGGIVNFNRQNFSYQATRLYLPHFRLKFRRYHLQKKFRRCYPVHRLSVQTQTNLQCPYFLNYLYLLSLKKRDSRQQRSFPEQSYFHCCYRKNFACRLRNYRQLSVFPVQQELLSFLCLPKDRQTLFPALLLHPLNGLLL